MNRLIVIHFVVWSAVILMAYTERIFGLPLIVLLILPVIIRYLNHEFNLQVAGLIVGLILGTVYNVDYWLSILLITSYLFFSRADKRRSYRRRLFWAIFYTLVFGWLIKPQVTWWFVLYHLLVVVAMLAAMYLNLFRRRKILQLPVTIGVEDAV